jgi:hypothetical protein
MAQNINLVIDQGTTYNTQFTITDANSVGINFYGYTGASQIRKHYSSNSSTSFTVALANTGVVSLSMNAAVTGAITAGRYVYDVEVTNVASANAVSRLVQGIVTVNPQVTR